MTAGDNMRKSEDMPETLESRALSGGISLVFRQLFGIAMSFVGMLVCTRLLGPHKYGQYAIMVGLMGYATAVGKLGLDVYLIRSPGETDKLKVGVSQALYLGKEAFLIYESKTAVPFEFL